MYLKSSFTLILFLVLSCQPVEILRPIEIDPSNLDTISIYSKNIEINKKYNSVFSQNNIEEQIQKSPIDVIVEWHNKNILKIGNENKLVINILDASITKNEKCHHKVQDTFEQTQNYLLGFPKMFGFERSN